jgi:hypothetical protein
MANRVTAQQIFGSQTTNGASTLAKNLSGDRCIQAIIRGPQASSATVSWYGSNTDNLTDGVLVATSTLLIPTGLTVFSTGNQFYSSWPYMYAVISAISGTGAAVTALISN